MKGQRTVKPRKLAPLSYIIIANENIEILLKRFVLQPFFSGKFTSNRLRHRDRSHWKNLLGRF